MQSRTVAMLCLGVFALAGCHRKVPYALPMQSGFQSVSGNIDSDHQVIASATDENLVSLVVCAQSGKDLNCSYPSGAVSEQKTDTQVVVLNARSNGDTFYEATLSQ